jgi:hypothetical protein
MLLAGLPASLMPLVTFIKQIRLAGRKAKKSLSLSHLLFSVRYCDKSGERKKHYSSRDCATTRSP